MPGAEFLVPATGARDLVSVASLRLTAVVRFVSTVNGHATAPANKNRKTRWYLICRLRYHVGSFLLTRFLAAEINTPATTGARHDVVAHFPYCRAGLPTVSVALKMYSRLVAPDGAMIPKQTTIAFVSLCCTLSCHLRMSKRNGQTEAELR
jgi:hypothetical protein